MNSSPPSVHDTLELVNRVDVAHPGPALIRYYVLDATQPQAAADYVQRRLKEDGNAKSLIADWTFVIESVISGAPPPTPSAVVVKGITERDGKRCCVTGKPGSFWDPLIVAPILPVPHAWLEAEERIVDLLVAFFGPQYFAWWQSVITRVNVFSPYQSHWLVRKSVHEALQRGMVKLVRMPPSMIEFTVENVFFDQEKSVDMIGTFALLGDYSRTGIEKVNAYFVGSHARFCKSIQLVNLARNIAPKLLPRQKGTQNSPKQSVPKHMPSSGSITHVFLRPVGLFWQFVPTPIRIAAYELLSRVGNRRYGAANMCGSVQRLPFGLYLKTDSFSGMLRNEYNALKLLEKYPKIPAPQALDIVSRKQDEVSYLLMTRMPGIDLAKCQEALSDQDLETISAQLTDCISRMRDIPKTVNPEMAICNTLGEACQDPRIRDCTPIGPFPDEASFSQHLRFSDEPSRRGHKILFTHADLNPRNILVERVGNSAGSVGWRLSGIVDWEAAGYYPEYWDYTKSMFEGSRWSRRYNEMIHGVFRRIGDYEKEFDAERRAWESGDAV